MTEAEIEACKSARGGWDKAALARLGVSWPPKKGWKKALAGKKVKKCADGTLPKDKWTKDTRDKLIQKINPAERHMQRLLNQCGVHFHRERPIVIDGKRFFIDFLVTSISVNGKRKKVRVAIEVDGAYHFTPEQKERDRAKDEALLKSSRVLSILRISTKRAFALSPTALRAFILYQQVDGVTRLYDEAACTPSRCTYPKCLCGTDV